MASLASSELPYACLMQWLTIWLRFLANDFVGSEIISTGSSPSFLPNELTDAARTSPFLAIDFGEETKPNCRKVSGHAGVAALTAHSPFFVSRITTGISGYSSLSDTSHRHGMCVHFVFLICHFDSFLSSDFSSDASAIRCTDCGAWGKDGHTLHAVELSAVTSLLLNACTSLIF